MSTDNMAQSPITPASSTPTATPTLFHESVNIPNFTGAGPETVHHFIQRINEECIRRSATSDSQKLSVLKSRISCDISSHAGQMLRSGKFEEIEDYQTYVTELRNHFQGHSKLGVEHQLITASRRIKQTTYTDPYGSENAATALSASMLDRLKDSEWVTDGMMTLKDVRLLMGYLMYTGFLDQDCLKIASEIPFSKTDNLFDLSKKICEKRPEIVPGAHPILVAKETVPPPPPTASSSSPSRQSRPFSRSRNFSRGRRQSPSPSNSRSRHENNRSKSRRRNVQCDRCKLPGHVKIDCRVVLDSNGKSTYNPNAYCTHHNRVGHTLQDCRSFKSEGDQSTNFCSRPSNHNRS